MTAGKQKKIKKLILSTEDKEKVLIAFGGRPKKNTKVIIKPLEKGGNDHFTMKMYENGSIDFHKTKEGKTKSYTPILKGKFYYQKFLENFISALFRQPIDPKNEKYQKHLVLIPKSIEMLTEFFYKYYVKGKKIITPDESTSHEIEEEIDKYFIIDYFPEITEHIFNFAFVITPDGDLIYLIRSNNAYFLLEIDEKDFDNMIKESLRYNRVDE